MARWSTTAAATSSASSPRAIPAFFNASNDDRTFDSRSDNKGPEPEAVTIGTIGGRTYAFIGLERIGGIMVYDVTDPTSPVFVDYVNNRDFTVDPATRRGRGPGSRRRDLHRRASDSPTRQPLLVVANEISGTVTTYGIEVCGRSHGKSRHGSGGWKGRSWWKDRCEW